MAVIIRQRQVVADNWQLLKSAADGSVAVPAEGDVIVPLGCWRAQRETLTARAGGLGIWLDSSEDPALVAADLRHFQVIAVNFPQFTDGRGYSIARLLRERYGWRGELRAIGDVLRDQLFYLSRCGFDAFALRAGQDAPTALAAFDDFSEGYQGSVERPRPLFRRR
ncbi:MAG: DUF934 domain-containing protein, partial [Burkholderiales bacterium]